MEPRQEMVPGGGEIPKISPEQPELAPDMNHEVRTGRTVEQLGAPQSPSVNDAQAAVQAVVPQPPLPTVDPQQATAPTMQDDAPLTANDDDLIEKEWVDKAKKIIASTKDDPYTREREVSKLQIEYIRRRYGREIGDTGD